MKTNYTANQIEEKFKSLYPDCAIGIGSGRDMTMYVEVSNNSYRFPDLNAKIMFELCDFFETRNINIDMCYYERVSRAEITFYIRDDIGGINGNCS